MTPVLFLSVWETPNMDIVMHAKHVFELHKSTFSQLCQTWPYLKPTRFLRANFNWIWSNTLNVFEEFTSNTQLEVSFVSLNKQVVVWFDFL